MSIFSAIRDAIFGGAANAAEVSPTPTAPSAPAATPAAAGAAMPSAAPAKSGAPTAAAPAAAKVDVAAILDKMTDESDEDDLDWRKSIVDLMKLLKMDSSLKARKSLAQELKYTGDMGDSASMNVWLHKQVMTKLAENGGIVPASLKH